MNISIRQAHKIVTKIIARMTTIDVSPNKNVTVWCEDPTDVIAEAYSVFNDSVTRTITLNNIRQEIRHSIGAANCIEINGLISKRKSLLDVIDLYRTIMSSDTGQYIDPAEIVMQMKAAKVQSANATTSYSRSDTINICVLNKTIAESMTKRIDQLQLDIEQVEEELTIANSSSTNRIQLSEETLNVLRAESIIAQ